MNKLTLFAVLALAARAAAEQMDNVNLMDNTLDAGYDSSRMVGGDIVTDGSSYPYMIAIQPRYNHSGVVMNAPVCSGVLIEGRNATTNTANYWVLTSAHCALSGTILDLYAGQTKVTIQSANDSVPSTRAIINEEYRESMLTGDLALIPTSINRTTSPYVVTPAILANADDATKSYLINTVTMAGWGFPNDVYAHASPSLRQLSSWVVPNWYCAVRNLGLPIKKTHMCTGGMPNKGPCTGDSGAPLIAKTSSADNSASATRVIGVATLTPRHGCSRGRPGVFTRLGHYLAWIIENTNYDLDQA